MIRRKGALGRVVAEDRGDLRGRSKIFKFMSCGACDFYGELSPGYR